jgi:glyoxylase-like metal-dependent hydrolase (beta-lactamase superfamily II)
MCLGRIPIGETSLPAPESDSSPLPGTTCFTASRLNDTTFQIVEDDKWAERPIIYAKVYPSTIVLLDTGCGGAARDTRAELKSLRVFLETFPVADNGNNPLNPGAERSYLVICTHCHFDHIGMSLSLSSSGQGLSITQVALPNSLVRVAAPYGPAPMTRIFLVPVDYPDRPCVNLLAWRLRSTL